MQIKKINKKKRNNLIQILILKLSPNYTKSYLAALEQKQQQTF